MGNPLQGLRLPGKPAFLRSPRAAPPPGLCERAGVLALLVCLNVLNYCDRTLPASFANYIMPDLSLSAMQPGHTRSRTGGPRPALKN